MRLLFKSSRKECTFTNSLPWGLEYSGEVQKANHLLGGWAGGVGAEALSLYHI